MYFRSKQRPGVQKPIPQEAKRTFPETLDAMLRQAKEGGVKRSELLEYEKKNIEKRQNIEKEIEKTNEVMTVLQHEEKTCTITSVIRDAHASLGAENFERRIESMEKRCRPEGKFSLPDDNSDKSLEGLNYTLSELGGPTPVCSQFVLCLILGIFNSCKTCGAYTLVRRTLSNFLLWTESENTFLDRAKHYRDKRAPKKTEKKNDEQKPSRGQHNTKAADEMAEMQSLLMFHTLIFYNNMTNRTAPSPAPAKSLTDDQVKGSKTTQHPSTAKPSPQQQRPT